MKILIFSLLLLGVSCAKSGNKNNTSIKEAIEAVPVVEAPKPLEIGEFEESLKNVDIDIARKVLYSENLKDITRVRLEVENISKVEVSYKNTTYSRKYCYRNAAPVTCSGTWCFNIPITCTDEATYRASAVFKKYGNLGFFPLANKKIDITYRALGDWRENKFQDDITLADLGVELFINDKFTDISKKDISVNTDTGDVNKLFIEFDIPQVEEGQLKLIAKPVYDNKTLVTGKVSPALYPCTSTISNKTFTSYVRSTSYIRDGKCIERTSYPEDIFHVEGGISSKTENITPRNKFDIKLRIQATRESEEDDSNEEE